MSIRFVFLLVNSVSAVLLPWSAANKKNESDFHNRNDYVDLGIKPQTTIGEDEVARTLNPEQIKDVKAALQDILGLDQTVSTENADKNFYTDVYDYAENMNPLKKNWWLFGRQATTSSDISTIITKATTASKETKECYTFPKTTTVTTTLTTTKELKIDINYILQLVRNLTDKEYYGPDITIHESLIKHFKELGVPTCGTPTTTTVTTTEPIYDFLNTSMGAKCFVCGLDDPGIPRDAACADAFAGDFIPLIPVDPKAKGKIAIFRKYCRVLDVQGTIINPQEPRALYGRWTGGCGVRWTDISGVYTQRTCRNRHRPMMGKHLASKRMAKLELSLINVDNGCIISPMATLLPLSRGISLFARFHACVCTGSWCNRTSRSQPWKFYTVITLIIPAVQVYGLKFG